MIRLTNLADYGVVLLCHLARRPKDLHNAVSLANETGLPVPTVSKIMGAISRAGLVTSHRGLKGGFKLARDARDINVSDIIEAIDGPIALTNCIENAPGECNLEPICAMKPHWQLINDAVKKGLAEVSLDEIAISDVPMGVGMGTAIAGKTEGQS